MSLTSLDYLLACQIHEYYDSLHTGHGTGFAGNTATLPAVVAYLARVCVNYRLGTNEVTQNRYSLHMCPVTHVGGYPCKAIQFNEGLPWHYFGEVCGVFLGMPPNTGVFSCPPVCMHSFNDC